MSPDSSEPGGCRGCAKILEDEKKGDENGVTVPENGSKLQMSSHLYIPSRLRYTLLVYKCIRLYQSEAGLARVKCRVLG